MQQVIDKAPNANPLLVRAAVLESIRQKSFAFDSAAKPASVTCGHWGCEKRDRAVCSIKVADSPTPTIVQHFVWKGGQGTTRKADQIMFMAAMNQIARSFDMFKPYTHRKCTDYMYELKAIIIHCP